MKAIAFFEEFQRVLEKDIREAQAAYCNNTQFTTFITQKINGILSQKEQKSQNEYFKLTQSSGA